LYSETDATDITNNDFKSFEYREQFSSNGIGIGMKLGMIYKPQEFWRLGFAFHTPQIISFKDQIRSSMTTDTEGYAGVKSESSDALNSGNSGIRRYSTITPWRAIASASYVFREVKDTRKQRAFLSADIEYVNYRGARFVATDDTGVDAEFVPKSYLKMVNTEVKDYYKGNVNFRLGGELKLHTIMFRLGGAYYGSPYKNKDLKANRILATGGIGYRDKGIFIDLAYVHSFNKDVVFPYRLNDKPNTFAEQTGSRENVMLTFGFKF
jgi:long-subunit fatty acid transport protein